MECSRKQLDRRAVSVRAWNEGDDDDVLSIHTLLEYHTSDASIHHYLSIRNRKQTHC